MFLFSLPTTATATTTTTLLLPSCTGLQMFISSSSLLLLLLLSGPKVDFSACLKVPFLSCQSDSTRSSVYTSIGKRAMIISLVSNVSVMSHLEGLIMVAFPPDFWEPAMRMNLEKSRKNWSIDLPDSLSPEIWTMGLLGRNKRGLWRSTFFVCSKTYKAMNAHKAV